MSDHPDTTPAPPSLEDTDRRGMAAAPHGVPPVVLGPEAMSSLLVRLVHGVESFGADVRELRDEVRLMRADLRLTLEEGRTHGRRLTALEEGLAEVRDRCSACRLQAVGE